MSLSACGSDEVIVALDATAPEVATPSDEEATEASTPLAIDASSVAPADGGAGVTDASIVDAPVLDAMAPHDPKDAGVASDASGEVIIDGGSGDASAWGSGTVPPVDAGLGADAGLPASGIHGVIHVSSALVLDADSRGRIQGAGNDHLDTAVSENDLSQRIGNPAWVGGYLGPRGACTSPSCSRARELDAGASAADDANAVDRIDYYRVELTRGQAVTLLLHPDPAASASSAAADLDLYLLDELRDDLSVEGGWREDSLGSADTEQVVAPRTGLFWIAVHRPDDEFSSNEPWMSARYSLLVNVPLSPLLQQRVSSNKLTTKTQSLAGRAVVRFDDGDSTSLEYEVIEFGETAQHSATRRDLRQIKQLRQLPGVRSAEPVIVFQPQGLQLPNDPGFARQWHTWPVDLLAGWLASEQAERPLGRDVVVAVVDTGVAMSHPDFVNADGSSQLLDDGYDMISDVTSAADGDGRDANPGDPGDGSATGGGTFHGTHCAGNIAAATNNELGIAGVAPLAKIRPVRVLGRGGGTLDDVVQGILYAAGLPNESGVLPDTPSDIINLSLAGPGRSALMADAIAAARAQGCIVIAAAGNFASPAEDYTPGGEAGVVTVSAVDAASELAWYSNYAISEGVIQLAGVGGDSRVDSTLDGYPDGIYSMLYRHAGTTLYGDIEGTSMAAAQVAGVAALMKGAWPQMTPDQFDELLPQVAIDVGHPGPDRDFGHGLVNVPKAVAAALAAAGNPHVSRAALHLSTRALDFGRAYDVLPLEIDNTGQGALEVLGSESEPWVHLTPAGIGANEVFVDRAALPPGEHLTSISIESNVGRIDVAVRVLVEAGLEGGDVGELVVLLLDADTNQVVDLTITGRQEDYSFQFADPGPGRYRVVAGSDWAQLGELGGAAEIWATPFGERDLCLGEGADAGLDCQYENPRGGVRVQLTSRLLMEPRADRLGY